MKPTAISQKVKKIVWERDKKCCIYCGKPVPLFNANAHAFIRRSHFGLGIPKNIVTLCNQCHFNYDSGRDKLSMPIKKHIHEYMYRLYPNLNIEELRYKNKWGK